MSKEQRVSYTVSEAIANIAMHRAPVNAIDHAMIEAIHAAMRRADEDP